MSQYKFYLAFFIKYCLNFDSSALKTNTDIDKPVLLVLMIK